MGFVFVHRVAKRFAVLQEPFVTVASRASLAGFLVSPAGPGGDRGSRRPCRRSARDGLRSAPADGGAAGRLLMFANTGSI